MIEPERLECILDFLATIDRFKSIARAVPLRDQSRLESDAEHTWHMGLFALLLERELALDVQLGHVLELILVHDLVEIYAGDAYGHDPVAPRDKRAREVTAATRLFPMLPPDLGTLLRGWWDEFEAARTPEARFARAIDRLQALAQNVLSGGRVWQGRGVTEGDEPRVQPRRDGARPRIGAGLRSPVPAPGARAAVGRPEALAHRERLSPYQRSLVT